MQTNLYRFIYFFVLSCFIPLEIEAQAVVRDTLDGGHLDEVHVSGLRPSTTRSAVPLQVMDNKDLNRIGIQSLSDVVRNFSGVTVKDYGGLGGLKTVSIRGMGPTHTAVSYDGVTVSDAQSGQVDIGRFSLDNLSMISLAVGQSDDIFQTARIIASAGSLNLKTIQPIFKDNKYSGKVQMKAGSFGFLNPSLNYAQKFNDTFSASVFGNWQKTDGNYPYTLKNGNEMVEANRKNSDLTSLNAELNLYGDFRKNGKMSLKAYYYDSDRGLPGPVILYNPYPSGERLVDDNFFTQLHYENQLNERISLQGQVKYNHVYTNYINPQYDQQDEYKQDEYYISGTALYKLPVGLSFSLAEDVFINTLWNNFPKCPFPERLTSLTALSAQYNNRKLSITGRLLGTYITEKVESGNVPDDKKKISPALSISYLPFDETDLRIRVSYKNIFRVPTFNDLYYSRIGNTNLLPETATQYNIGLTWTGSLSETIPYLIASTDVYHNKVHDKIIAIPTLFIWKMMNAGEVDARGVDVNLKTKVHLKEQWELEISGNYSYQKAIDVTDKSDKHYKNQIPYTPENSGSVVISIENPWVNVSYNLIMTGLKYSLAQNIPDNRINGYCDQNISLNKTLKIKTTNLRIQGDVLNVSDQSYEVIKWYPMPGRSYRLSLKLEF